MNIPIGGLETLRYGVGDFTINSNTTYAYMDKIRDKNKSLIRVAEIALICNP